jgi:hypothetical protein
MSKRVELGRLWGGQSKEKRRYGFAFGRRASAGEAPWGMRTHRNTAGGCTALKGAADGGALAGRALLSSPDDKTTQAPPALVMVMWLHQYL